MAKRAPEQAPDWLCPKTLRYAADYLEFAARWERASHLEALLKVGGQNLHAPQFQHLHLRSDKTPHFPGEALLRARKHLRRKATVTERQRPPNV